MDAVLILRQLADLIARGVPADQPVGGAAQLVDDLRDTAVAVMESAGLSEVEVGHADSYGGDEWRLELTRNLYGRQRTRELYAEQDGAPQP